ncbi:MAG TPA: hypothetical protein VNW29_04325 [Candidatus Sulfotelmatobacter sp.]|jgi:hypothetical protein|nr:hypothetical protein [Candidatus Sulfotelmatobacter sp.]
MEQENEEVKREEIFEKQVKSVFFSPPPNTYAQLMYSQGRLQDVEQRVKPLRFIGFIDGHYREE